MSKYNIFVLSFLVVLFLGLMLNMLYQYNNKNIIVRETQHYYRRYGLAPPNCPFRYQYY